MLQRRTLLAAGLGGVVTLRPAAATPSAMQAAVLSFTGGRAVRDGRVVLEIAPLVDNGNVVPVRVSVQSAMSAAEHVKRIALFNESNPLPEVAMFHLGPRSGRAEVATRMRLATSQHVLALAEMSDGTLWRQQVEVVVTLAACIE